MIEIKELTTVDSLSEVSEIEEKVWGMAPLPVHQTLTAVKNGGLVIGAYDQNRLIGFSYGFAGFKDGKTYLCSHMLGIGEAYRSKKIGEKLKQKQRERAIAKGYTEMHWTYDPLETRNAYLNLTKLNGICSTYMEDAYGQMKDGINEGLPSDRFEIHWHLTSPYVTEHHHIDVSNAVYLNNVAYDEDHLPVFTEVAYDALDADSYIVKVPKEFQDLKHQNQSLALDWRYKTRYLFQKLFQAGYAAVALEPGEGIAEYTFIKKETINLEALTNED